MLENANREIADLFSEIARLVELDGGNPFKVRAYAQAAAVLGESPEPVGRLAAENRLQSLAGVGEAIAKKTGEWLETGRVEFLEKLRAKFPDTVVDLLDVVELGPKRVRALWLEHGMDSLDMLREACLSGRFAGFKGCDAELEGAVLRRLEELEAHRVMFRTHQARTEAESLLAWVADTGLAVEAEIAGSLRRRREVVKDIKIVAACADPGALAAGFTATPKAAMVVSRRPDRGKVVLEAGMEATLHAVPPGEYPAALVHHTGSRAHNALLRQRAAERGLTLNERGLFGAAGAPLPCADEAGLYAALGLPWIPPELRENLGEFELAGTPRLVTPEEVRGVVHCHSDWSDGVDSLERMACAARELGYEYMAVTDHSRSADYANGLTPDRVAAQHVEIDRLNAAWGDFRLLKGIESEIHPDGSLDYGDEMLSLFDVVIASIHTETDMTRREATRRVMRAIEHPKTMIL
ncbi:MAG: hypothetical protein GX580_13225, partial [Candidatus Hydrogenedens sp.]|nr:hypothetical protein [Candidatus Hydrogenedens sp.]